LCSNFARVPTDEHLITRAEVGDATQFGAGIVCTDGIYAAELQAIARALAMFPLPCTLHVHSDSKGALAGIRAYLRECNARRRLRMSARPLLQLIAHLLTVREQAGGSVHWHHVKAHSQSSDIDSVGNRVTDWLANHARAHKQNRQPLQLRELPLGECEHFLTVQQHQHTVRERQLIDDPRRCAVAQLRANALSKWCGRRDAAHMCDGALAGPEMLDLSRVVLAAGTPTQQATLINVATNSIQCAWTPAADNSQRVRPLDCPDCADVACTLGHLAECSKSHASGFRSNLHSDIFAVLGSVPYTAAWRRQHGRDSLQQILLLLFPIAYFKTTEEKHLHFTRLLCGAFSARQANVAAKSLGFPNAEDGRPTLQRIRLACLDRIAQVFSDLKKVAAS
jgi:ribonuclease HI